MLTIDQPDLVAPDRLGPSTSSSLGVQARTGPGRQELQPPGKNLQPWFIRSQADVAQDDRRLLTELDTCYALDDCRDLFGPAAISHTSTGVGPGAGHIDSIPALFRQFQRYPEPCQLEF